MRNLRQLLRSTPWLGTKKPVRSRRGHDRSVVVRRLHREMLEKRQLLAGDIAYAHNYWHAADVDDNREITAGDALRVINLLSRQGGGFEVTEPGQIDSFADVNADGWVTAGDALAVINSLSRGEGTGHLVEMELNARDINDDALTTAANRNVTVDVGEVFYLELSYNDLRDFGSDIGAFQIMTDIAFEVDGMSAANAITPIITETQFFVLELTIRDRPEGSLFFSLEDSTAPPYEVTAAQLRADGPIPHIEDALVSFGYSEDQFQVRRIIDNFLTFPGQGEDPRDGEGNGNLSYEIRYTDPTFTGVDLPNLQVTTNFSNGARADTLARPPVNPDGSLNGDAAGNSLDVRSRTAPSATDRFGREIYNLLRFGSFDSGFGFVEVGAIGPAVEGGIRQFLGGEFPEPFDAFSVPIIINQPVVNMEISLRLSDNNERVLLYGRDQPLPLDDIELGSSIFVTAVGDPLNFPPVAVDDTATTQEGVPVDINVLANDTDADGDALTAILGSVAPTKGSVSINTDGTIRYTPAAGEFGVDTFTYLASDGQAVSDEATVTVTIVEVNDPPTLDGPVEATFSEDDLAATVDLLDGAFDPDEDILSVVNLTLTSGDAAGITFDSQNNLLDVNPGAYNSLAQGETEVIVYSYGVSDGQGNVVPQTATITIIGENDAPLAGDDTATADGTNPVLIDVLANDSDPDGDALTVALGTAPQFGSFELVNDGGVQKIRYTADDNVELVDTFTYTISDGIADPVEATVTVNVFEQNLPPTVEGPLTESFTEATGVQTFDLLAGASDPNDDSLSVTDLVLSPTAPLGVTVIGSIVSVDTDLYQSLAQDEVSDPIEFSYNVSDGQLSVAQTATLTIIGVNDPPLAGDDTANTIGTNPVLIDVLDNDSDPDGDTLTVALGTPPQFGSFELVQDGGVTKIRYTADDNIALTDTFTYTISDGIADPVEATVTVNVFEQNLPPVLEGSISESFTEATGVQSFDLLAGANDPNGDPLSITNLSVSPSSPLGVSLSGTIVSVNTDLYQSLAQDEVSDPIEFSYRITDGEFSVEQTATLTIVGVNDPPVAVDDTANTVGTNPVLVDVLSNDSDPDGDALTVALGTAPQFGSFELVQDNGVTKIRYTADDNTERTDTFTYTISDGIADPVEATVTVNVFEQNLPPVLDGSVIENFTEGTGTQSFDLLSGASDPNGDALSVVNLVVSPMSPLGVTINGSQVSVNTEAYQFLSQDELSAAIEFSYGITDGEFTVTQTATLTITGVNDSPEAVDDAASTLKNLPVTIAVLDNDTDPDINDVLSIDSVTDGGNGSVTVNADGTLTYTPNQDFTGQDTFTYTVTDGLASSEATVTVTVNDFAPSTVAGSIFFDHLENLEQFLKGASPIRNGVQDDDESGLGGVPVKLVSEAGENVTGERVELVVHTGLHGNYEFDGVAPGTYKIVYEIPDTIVFGANGDGSSEAGVMEIMIGAAGGESFEEMNFTLIDTVGSALGNIDLLSSSYLRSNPDVADSSNGGREGGLVSLSETGEQLFFKALRGFDGIAFAELTLNQARDAALLTIIDESGTVRTARLSDDQFVVNREGTAVQFFGGYEDFNFSNPGTSLADEFEDYRNAIDKVIADYV